jgi:hypothetical protein
MRLGFGELLVLLVLGVVIVLPLRLQFCRELAKALRTYAQNEEAPQAAWFILVPIFGVGWEFHLLRLLARKLRDRARELGLDLGNGGYGRARALAGWLTLASFPFSIPEWQIVRRVAAVLAFIIWLAYWAWLSSALKRLELAAAGSAEPVQAG